jgi:hypothetical protein
MGEWMAEAMGYMKTKVTLRLVYKDVKVVYHKGRMPCGLIAVAAIQYGRCRLPYYHGDMSARSLGDSVHSNSPSVYPGIPKEGDTLFGTHLVKREAVSDGVDVEFYETDLQKLNACPADPCNWYYSELDYINTSFSDGYIRVHYRAMPVDESGFPLIPDDELYKEALYYYIRAKMVGAGYEDKVFREETLMSRFEDYAARAMSRIRYPSVDEVAARVDRMTRLVLPEYDTFHTDYLTI